METSIRSRKHYSDLNFFETLLDGSVVEFSEFEGCRFVSCSYSENSFLGCKFRHCTFERCDLSLVRFQGSSLSRTRFIESKVIGIDWTDMSWAKSKLNEPLEFVDSTLNHSTFIGLDLRGTKFVRCIVVDVDFREANLSKSQFIETDLTKSLFLKTDLSGADFTTARNYDIKPENNTLTGARFSLPEAMSLLFNLDIILDEDD